MLIANAINYIFDGIIYKMEYKYNNILLLNIKKIGDFIREKMKLVELIRTRYVDASANERNV